MTRHYQRFDIIQFRQFVAESKTFSEVVRKLGRKPTGSNISSISHRCKRHDVDTSHMTGQAHARGRTSSRKKFAVDWLVMGTSMDLRSEARVLRRCLLELNVAHVCNVCGINEWLQHPLVLEIDHIDGQYWNNTKENLQFICPNCHSLKK